MRASLRAVELPVGKANDSVSKVRDSSSLHVPSPQLKGCVVPNSRRLTPRSDALRSNHSFLRSRDFPFNQRVRLQFRAEFFNHTLFRRPNIRFGNNNFGNITAAESARIGQLGLKLYF